MNASSGKRYLSVWLRRLATDRIARVSPASADQPLVFVASIKSALRITALNDAAACLRLKTGMALADARAMYPSLAVEHADPDADQRLLEAIADWCDRYTPLVGLAPPDGLAFDITGCAHLFGGEKAFCRDLVTRLAAQGFAANVAVADTFGCAFAAAHFSEIAITLVPPGDMRATLAPLPLSALRLPPEVVDALTQVGLKHIGDVLERPRAPLAARFGVECIRRIDQALGREDEPIKPRLPVPAVLAERRFADPIALEADVLGTIEQLARDLDRMLERRGEGARLLQVALFRADGAVHRVELGTSAPVRDPARVRCLFADRLAVLGDACDPGFGFDMLRLSALVTERFDPTQTGLIAPDQDAELTHLIDRLGARFGLRRVTRLVPQDTHIPEFATVAMPAHASLGGGAQGAERRLPLLERVEDHDSLIPARPIRLFDRPERVEAIAEVPDGPPVRFRWRHVLHEVARSEGPERIAMEWWRDQQGHALTRDYFRVESRQGARVWLYREGLYGRETAQPRWFLHGLFA
jgi:protein ImuB